MNSRAALNLQAARVFHQRMTNNSYKPYTPFFNISTDSVQRFAHHSMHSYASPQVPLNLVRSAFVPSRWSTPIARIWPV